MLKVNNINTRTMPLTTELNTKRVVRNGCQQLLRVAIKSVLEKRKGVK